MPPRRKSTRKRGLKINLASVFATTGTIFVGFLGVGYIMKSPLIVTSSIFGLIGLAPAAMALSKRGIRDVSIVQYKEKKTGKKSIFLRSKSFAEKVAKKQGGLAMKTKKGFIVIKGNRAIKVIKESMRPYKPPKIKRSHIRNLKFSR